MQDEYNQLSKDYPGKMDGLIEEMSAYLAANGKAYQNCEAALHMMNVLQDLVMEGANPVDYLDEEGLLCCGNCHTRMQAMYDKPIFFRSVLSRGIRNFSRCPNSLQSLLSVTYRFRQARFQGKI